MDETYLDYNGLLRYHELLQSLLPVNKQATSNGTDLSLVTTGEKATWNAKQNALTFNTTPSSSNKVATMADIPSIPSDAVFTDVSVTSVDNHYTPSANANSELTASISGTAGTYALDTEYTVLTGVKAQRDAKGHVTGLTYTAQKIKDTNTTYSVFTTSANGLAPAASTANKQTNSSDNVAATSTFLLGADTKYYKLPANAFNNTTYSAATQSAAGLMSAADKEKLDGITSGATANAGTVTGITIGTGGTNYTPTNGIITIPAYPEGGGSAKVKIIPYVYGWDNITSSDFNNVLYNEIAYDTASGKLYKWSWDNSLNSGSLSEINPGWNKFIVSVYSNNTKHAVIDGAFQSGEYSWEGGTFYALYSQQSWPLFYLNIYEDEWYDDILYLDSFEETDEIDVETLVSGFVTYPILDARLNNLSATKAYKDITYTVYVPSSNSSGALSLNFNNGPVQVYTLSANVSSISTSNIPAGHSLHVIFRSSSTSYTRTVAIAHNATTSCCPGGSALSLTVPKLGSGYTEVDFLNVNNIIYVRGV